MAPAGTSSAIVERVNRETLRILALPDVRKRFADLGLDILGGTPAEFTAAMEREIPQWAKVITPGRDQGRRLAPLMSRSQRTQRLLALFEGGRFREAEIVARELVAAYPDFAFAWKVLGATVSIQGGNGVPMLLKAVQLMPDDHEGHNNLGNALKDLGRHEDAVRSYRRALEPRRTTPMRTATSATRCESWRAGTRPRAAAAARLELDPASPRAVPTWRTPWRISARSTSARRSLQRALELDPDVPGARSKLLYLMNCLDARPERRCARKLADTARPWR